MQRQTPGAKVRMPPARFPTRPCPMPHPSTGTIEQLDTQFQLKRPDLLAKRRLGDAKPDRGPAEMQFLRNAQKVAKMA